jgi:hypothetical protein
MTQKLRIDLMAICKYIRKTGSQGNGKNRRKIENHQKKNQILIYQVAQWLKIRNRKYLIRFMI